MLCSPVPPKMSLQSNSNEPDKIWLSVSTVENVIVPLVELQEIVSCVIVALAKSKVPVSNVPE